MASPIVQAIQQICDEKGISYDAVIETIEAALAAAYRKDFGEKNQNIKVEFDPEIGGSRVFDVKKVVSNEFVEEAIRAMEEKAAEEAEEAEKPAEEKQTPSTKEAPGDVVATGEPVEEEKYHPKLHLALREARELKPDAQVGEELRIELDVPEAYGRMAAQTAKQVITQRLREAERFKLYEEFKEKENMIVVGTVQRREGRVILVDLGRVAAIMLPEDQMPNESYEPGDRVKVYVVSVQMSTKGPEIRVSRTHPDIVRTLFTVEIPEVASGAVLIHAIAREAGSRTKVAVSCTQENVDPIGSCIGQRGSRIQTIIGEIGGEKIDIIEWSEDVETFIRNAMSPAQVKTVELNEDEKIATVHVDQDQLSLAIGRGGQNVRLAARLVGWTINVVESEGGSEEGQEEAEEVVESEGGSEEGQEEAEEVVESEGLEDEAAPESEEQTEGKETQESEQDKE